MPSTTSYLLIGLVAAVATFAFTPLVALFARRVGWVVEPDERRIHSVATPDVGGIAMFIGLTAAPRSSATQQQLRHHLRPQRRAARSLHRGVPDVHDRSVRRRPRDLRACQGGRHDRGCRRVDLLRRDDVLLPRPVRRRLHDQRRLDPVDHGRLAARHDAGDQPHRRPRRPRCGHRRDRCGRVLHLQPATGPTPRCACCRRRASGR